MNLVFFPKLAWYRSKAESFGIPVNRSVINRKVIASRHNQSSFFLFCFSYTENEQYHLIRITLAIDVTG